MFKKLMKWLKNDKPKGIYNISVTTSHSVVVHDHKLFIDGIQYREEDKLPEGVSVSWR